MNATTLNKEDYDRLIRNALGWSLFTVIYNIIEGVISVYFGVADDSLSLFGFGLDSFIETISAIGIAHMIYRMKKYPDVERGKFEITALKITGWCFYLLAVFLFLTAVMNVVDHKSPTSTLPGVIITSISIISMIVLIRAKKSIGRKLNSSPMIADANCNLVCVYMSIVVLVASALFEIFRIGYFDVLGTLGIVYFSIREGRESFQKAKNIDCCCSKC